jgi:hypothetical protein
LAGRNLNVLDSKLSIVRQAMAGLPKTVARVPLRDLADEFEGAKNRRITPSRYEAELGRAALLPAAQTAKLYERYEELKAEAGLVDFEDLLEEAITMYETDKQALVRFKRRYLAFTVDEYQDVNLLQQTLLDRWLNGRHELCVVGDDYQRRLLRLAERDPESRALVDELDDFKLKLDRLGDALRAVCREVCSSDQFTNRRGSGRIASSRSRRVAPVGRRIVAARIDQCGTWRSTCLRR